MSAKTILTIGGIFGALSVAIGAFGAHGLRDMLIENGRVETFETAVKYQFYHTLAVLLIGILAMRSSTRHLSYAVYAMITGIIIFSGSLYILCLTNMTFLGAITPIGGFMFILGWILLTIGAAKLN